MELLLVINQTRKLIELNSLNALAVNCIHLARHPNDEQSYLLCLNEYYYLLVCEVRSEFRYPFSVLRSLSLIK